MECRLAHTDDLPVLKEIWYEVFLEHDPKETIDFYFENNFDIKHTFVLENKKGKIVSTLQLNQHDLMLNHKPVAVSFVVGVATLPKEQRKGYMRILLDYAIEYAQENLKQEMMILQAYNWDVYRSFGFYEAYYKSELTFSLADLDQYEEVPLETVESRLLLNIYEVYTINLNGYKIRDLEYFDDHQKALAVDKTLIASSESAYLFYQVDKEEMIVSETAYKDETALFNLLKTVANKNKVTKVQVSTDIKNFNENKTLFMMIKNLADKNINIDDHWYISEWI